ncbi:MAG: DNA polymerase III subunit delta [Anaerolineales bacterium]
MGPPSVYLLYGDDPISIRETLHELQDRLGPAAEFNLQRFKGGGLDLGAFQLACNSLPFLSGRRLIVVEEAEALPEDAAWRRRFEEILGELPATTALVLIERIDTERNREEKKQQARSIGLAWAEAHPEAVFVRRFACPRGPAFVRWLQERARSLGGTIDPPAAQLLAERLGENPLLADQELRKLLDLADGARPVSTRDVERLTPDYGETDVFAVVDQLGTGSGWVGQLEQLLADHDPAYVFAMIVRQVRLLLQARAALETGEDPIAAIRAPAFVAKKISSQARGFSLPALKSIHRRLTQLDLAVKRGEAELSLDLLPVLVGFTR